MIKEENTKKYCLTINLPIPHNLSVPNSNFFDNPVKLKIFSILGNVKNCQQQQLFPRKFLSHDGQNVEIVVNEAFKNRSKHVLIGQKNVIIEPFIEMYGS